MNNISGFTLLELMIVIGIIGILSTIAVPNMIAWRNNARFNGAVNTLAADLTVAKQSAIRNNAEVVTRFINNGYTVFIDSGDGAGGAPNTTQDAGELVLRDRILPNGVTINLAASTMAGNFTRFTGTGRCTNVGLVVISQANNQNSVDVNRLGRINIL